MKASSRLMLLCGLLGALLTAIVLLSGYPSKASTGGPLNAGPSASSAEAASVPTVVAADVHTILVSNEAPGRLIDHLIAQGQGDLTLFELLTYLKDQSAGIISDAFYHDVATAPAGSELYTALVHQYASLNGAVEISADGTIHTCAVRAGSYDGQAGYGTAASQDREFLLTYAEDTGRYIYTGSSSVQVGWTVYQYDYYATAICWRAAPTPTPTKPRVRPVYLPLAMR